MMRRFPTLMIAAALTAAAIAAAVVAAPAGAATRPNCGVTWGSAAKTSAGSTHPLIGVRAGEHDCYDRLVFDFAGTGGVASVGYSPVVTQGQGTPLALRGAASLDIALHSPAYNPTTGAATFAPAKAADIVDVHAFRTFRQVSYGGSFEGYTTIGVGVRARLPFRVFVVPGPGANNRLVIDVAHRW